MTRNCHRDPEPQRFDAAASNLCASSLVESPAELARSSDILFSTVTSSSALDAARQTVAFLEPRHLYADLNSVSPALKQSIETLVCTTGAMFVEAAVMAPVQPYGHRVPMLACGDDGRCAGHRLHTRAEDARRETASGRAA